MAYEAIIGRLTGQGTLLGGRVAAHERIMQLTETGREAGGGRS